MKDAIMKLCDIASTIKSANAGASQLTFDIGFDDAAVFRQVVASGVLNADLMARLYKVPPASVQIYAYDPASVIKMTIPRGGLAGGVNERDFDGVQQFPLLLDVEIPLPGAPATEPIAESATVSASTAV